MIVYMHHVHSEECYASILGITSCGFNLLKFYLNCDQCNKTNPVHYPVVPVVCYPVLILYVDVHILYILKNKKVCLYIFTVLQLKEKVSILWLLAGRLLGW